METLETQFPFTGLHVYQRTQEAWTLAQEWESDGPLVEVLLTEIQHAALGIARGTARSRGHRSFFLAELEDARARGEGDQERVLGHPLPAG